MKIAIASGKGGTGKTTLATNLTAFIAESEKVILVDLDVEEPNSGLFIRANLLHEDVKYKMVPEWDEEVCTVCGLCHEVCNFHAIIQLGNQIMVFPELCHNCYACSELCPVSALPMKSYRMGVMRHFQNGNITFIESRLDIGQEQAVPLIAQTNEFIKSNFNQGEIVLLDAPPGTSCPVIEATAQADYVILVTEPTPFGLHDLKLAVETIRQLNKEFGVVINRDGAGDGQVLEYCAGENIGVLARIPDDRRVAELYSHGSLVYTKIPEFKAELKKIFSHIRIHIEEVKT
jgi:MinD superfamily P-loop ATPase